MSQYLIILSCFLSVLEGVESEVTTVQEGQDASIKCSHTLARDNVKYFCRDPCTHEDVLITSDCQNDSQPRFSLLDHGDGDFVVTISKVKFTDAGIYYCGVDRSIKDTFEKVTLKVTPAQTTQPVGPSITQPGSSTDHDVEDKKGDSSEEDNVAYSNPFPRIKSGPVPKDTSKQAEGAPSGVVYIGVGLAAVVFVLVLSLSMFYTQKTRVRKASAPSAGHTPNTRSGSNYQVQCEYAEITSSPCHPTSNQAPASTGPSPIYSNVLPPSNQNPDSMDYSTVRFDRDEESLQYATLRFTDPPAGGYRHQSTSGSVIYSTINL
ncbi:CMRF35-like molecule 1 [Sardina pilchardus]|uniref:CMRF35-like molecule 1 n=1 Tax=Sardina pilchardus TaxID=27697 RepID=UPI002E11B011